MRRVEAEDREERVRELEWIATSALGRPARDARATIFVLQALTEKTSCLCLRCGRAAPTVGSWKPNAACLRRDFAMPAGETAVVLYPLCDDCFSEYQENNPSVMNAVERVILESLRAEAMIPAVEAP